MGKYGSAEGSGVMVNGSRAILVQGSIMVHGSWFMVNG